MPARGTKCSCSRRPTATRRPRSNAVRTCASSGCRRRRFPQTRLSVSFDIAFTMRPSRPRRLRELLDEFQPDVIHQHGQFFDLTWATGRYARRHRDSDAAVGSHAAGESEGPLPWRLPLARRVRRRADPAPLPAADRRHGRPDGRLHQAPLPRGYSRAGLHPGRRRLRPGWRRRRREAVHRSAASATRR